MSAASASSTPPRGRPSDGHLEDKKIACLVVEDDPFQMAAISQLIGKAETAAGLDVSLQFASNAVEAVEASAQNNIDLVLLDFLLPGGRDGATALPEIRENIGKASSIIMISGSAQEAPMRACLSNGADSFRLKPFGVSVVTDLLTYTMRKRRFLIKRRSRRSKNSRSPSVERDANDPVLNMSPDTVLAYGRRSVLYMGLAGVSPTASPPRDDAMDTSGTSPARGEGQGASGESKRQGGTPLAIKVSQMTAVRGPPPPYHKHVNKVYKRLVEYARHRRELIPPNKIKQIVLFVPSF